MKENIDQLLEEYFEGHTSLGEEELLRDYFRREDLPPHLQAYRGLFGYMNQERAAVATGVTPGTDRTTEPTENHFPLENAPPMAPIHRRIRPLIWTIMATAACIAITAGYFRWSAPSQECPCLESSYAMIDGKCYTDKVLIEHFMNQSRKTMAEGLMNDPLSDQLQSLDFFGETAPQTSNQ